jgi:hypothetical protein
VWGRGPPGACAQNKHSVASAIGQLLGSSLSCSSHPPFVVVPPLVSFGAQTAPFSFRPQRRLPLESGRLVSSFSERSRSLGRSAPSVCFSFVRSPLCLVLSAVPCQRSSIHLLSPTISCA